LLDESQRGAPMHPQQDVHSESALYWTAISLIVCEGMPIDKAAEKLGVEGVQLRELLERRQAHCPYGPDERPAQSMRH
jgi:hypothetical protein